MARILAPAGGMEQLTAAVRCDADAVYLGVQDFNARRNAANFDSESLPEAVAYCHARNTEVYVTVNTLILDSEMEMLERSADASLNDTASDEGCFGVPAHEKEYDMLGTNWSRMET